MKKNVFCCLGLFAFVAAGSGAAAEDPQVLTNRAVHLARRGRWAEAVQPLREAAHRDPALALACHNLGLVLVQQGSYEAGLASLRRTLEIDDLPVTHEALGLALLYLDHNEEALAEYDVARRSDRASASTLFNWGPALERLKRLAEAEEASRAALASEASFEPAHAAVSRLTRGRVVSGLAC